MSAQSPRLHLQKLQQSPGPTDSDPDVPLASPLLGPGGTHARRSPSRSHLAVNPGKPLSSWATGINTLRGCAEETKPQKLAER